MNCPACGYGAPEGARFCPSCGHELAARADERRVVTVVFADLVGFTALSETRDPEQIKNLVDGAFQRLARDVVSFGGRIDKIVGDGIVALFGDPIAHEDDAERGVRAALKMHETLEAFCMETGSRVRIRVAVNTGEVLVGAVGTSGERTAMGDVVNICSRLQASAEPGTTIVGPETYAATRSSIVYEQLGPVEVRGRVEPVAVWLALKPTGLPGDRRPKSIAPLVGRDSEVAMATHALRATVQRARPGLVVFVGEAGMGTSRLSEEIADIARSDYSALVLEGRAVPYGEANAWWPIAEVVRQACRIEPNDTSDVATRKCREAISAATGRAPDEADTRRVADGLLYLLGFEVFVADAEPSRAQLDAARSLATLLAGSARERPVIVLLADLHWADKVVLELIDRLPGELRSSPVLIVATARPELEDQWRPAGGRHNQLIVHLDPLGEEATVALVAHLVPDAPPDIRSLLVSNGGGNPLFVEELAALLTESDVLNAGGSPDEPQELPATLRGLVAARLDSLSTDERATLEDAAVIGASGPLAVLGRLASARGGRSRLDGLEDKDILVVSGDQWRFKSLVVRDVAYGTITKAERARKHATVAEWLSDRARATHREEEQLGRIAHHYGAAAMLVAELGHIEGVDPDLGVQALRMLERAALRLENQGLYRAAAHLLDHAFRLLPDTAERPWQLLLARARARIGLRDLPGARADATDVLALAEDAGETATVARALTALGDVAEKEGRGEEASETLGRAIELWRQVGDREGEAEALRLWGMTMLFAGDIDGAQRAVTEAMDASREAGDERGEAWALQSLAWIAFTGGDLASAEARLEASTTTFVDAGDARGAAWARGLLGFVRLGQGRFEEAAELAEAVLESAQERGDRWGLGMMLTLLANIRLWQGRTNDCVERAREARRLFRAIDDRWGAAQAMAPLARSLVMTGSVPEGLAIVDELLDLASAMGDPIIRGMAGNVSASVAVQLGDAERAFAEAPVSAGLSTKSGPVIAGAIHGLAVLQRGSPPESISILEEAAELGSAEAAAYLALACAAAGRPLAARRAAGLVDGSPMATYLDRVWAQVASGFAALQEDSAAEAEAGFATARATADATEDVLAQSIVQLAHAHARVAAGAPNARRTLTDARQRLSSVGVEARGWERVFESVRLSRLGMGAEVADAAAGDRPDGPRAG